MLISKCHHIRVPFFYFLKIQWCPQIEYHVHISKIIFYAGDFEIHH